MVSLVRDIVSNNRIGFRAVRFCTVGGVGALILMGVTFFLTEMLGLYYLLSTAIAILVATVWNFVMHGYFTYRVFRLPGASSKRNREDA